MNVDEELSVDRMDRHVFLPASFENIPLDMKKKNYKSIV